MEPVKPRSSDAFRLSLDANDIVMEFGNVLQPEATGGGAAVSVSDRVVMQVDTGRRLLHWLNQCVEQHAAALKADATKGLSPADAAAVARPGRAPIRPPASAAGERGAELLRLVGNLGVPHQYERSFRICDRTLLANRFLLTVDPNSISGERCGRTLEICDRLRIPQAARDAVVANFAMAQCIHFGFESDDDTILCKLYLERAVPEEEAARARAAREPVLLHLAFKWDLVKDISVTTRYLWYPGLSASGIEDRLAHVYRDGPQASFEIARDALALTRDRVPAERLQYLEVEEAENGRRSFDLNLYDAQLQVKDMQHLLHRMRERFGVRPGRLQALYDQIKTKSLGHLAGGVHRSGEDFFNVYYGVVGLAGGVRDTAAEQSKGLPPTQVTTAPQPGRPAVRPLPDESNDRGAELRRMVGALGVPYHYERSVRMHKRALLDNRFLLTIDVGDIPGDRVKRTLEICDRLQMPAAAREAAAGNFAIAKCVHFGFEADESSIIAKFYLERDVPADEARRARDRGEPVLLYLAFKWDLEKEVTVTTRYWWHPYLPLDEIEKRLADVYREGPQISFEIARATLALTRGRVTPEVLQYNEVQEAENARRSFVLSLYNAKLQVKDLQHLLHRMREHFAVAPDQLQALYDQIKSKPLGHLAGGVHRKGEDFFSVYYRVDMLPHFHSGFC
jgi:hypothetical protein